jgi:hypothetical protein
LLLFEQVLEIIFTFFTVKVGCAPDAPVPLLPDEPVALPPLGLFEPLLESLPELLLSEPMMRT